MNADKNNDKDIDSILFPVERPDTSEVHIGKPAPGSWEVHVRLWNMFKRFLGGTGDLGNTRLEELLKELLEQGGSLISILEKLTIFGERLDDIDENIDILDQNIKDLSSSTDTRFEEVNNKITSIQNMLSSGLVRGSTFSMEVSAYSTSGNVNLPSGRIFVAYDHSVNRTSIGESGTTIKVYLGTRFTFVNGGRDLQSALGIKNKGETEFLVGAYLY